MVQLTQNDLDAVENLLRHGSTGHARRVISGFAKRPIPREHVAKLAHLALNAHLPSIALRILGTFVRPRARANKRQPSVAEQSYYAAALARVGAIAEAFRIFQGLPTDEFSEVSFTLAMSYLRVWDWNRAIALLTEYLRHSKLTEYEQILGATYLAGTKTQKIDEYKSARPILETILKQTSPARHRKPHLDSLIFLVQSHFNEKDWAGAKQYLKQLDAACAGNELGFINFVIEQWKAIVEINVTGGSISSRRRLHVLRDQFAQMGQWEYVRSSDFYEAKSLRDPKLLTRVYFATPYSYVRAEIREILGADIPATFDWFLTRSDRRKIVLNVSDGSNSVSPARLKSGHQLQKLLVALTRDLYRPPQIAELFEILYPGEYYRSESSPDRIHQTMRRLRSWLNKNNIPLKIAVENDFYRLQSSSGMILQLTDDDCKKTPEPSRDLLEVVQVLKNNFGYTPFTLKGAATALESSERTLLRRIHGAIELKLIERLGASAATKYRIL